MQKILELENNYNIHYETQGKEKEMDLLLC